MKNIDKIIKENINRFILREWGDFTYSSRDNVDVHDWLNIGIINYWPYEGKGFLDIWSNPLNYKDYVILPHKDNGIGRNEGTLGNIPNYASKDIKIFDEYKDTDYSIPFLGKKKNEDDIERHKIFMSKLNLKDGNKVLLQHNSNIIIKDGLLSSGHEKQKYSNNSDLGWYSWGTKNIGKDPSNIGQYTYYALVDIDEIYDFQNDLERINDFRKAAYEKAYVAVYWRGDTDSIAVVSYKPTPILYILDKQNGKKFDSNWNEIS